VDRYTDTTGSVCVSSVYVMQRTHNEVKPESHVAQAVFYNAIEAVCRKILLSQENQRERN
jgi:hypothetical protein